MMRNKRCGSTFLLALPQDLFEIVTKSGLSPRDLCSLTLCCKSLQELVTSEKIWLAQCEALGLVSSPELIEWRKGVSSFKSLCRFLVGISPFLGIWVSQNPDIGNVVYVMPGFLSAIGCRILPQQLPLGLEDNGPIRWAPVFEIICDYDGSAAAFFLHGRENGCDYVCPGFIKQPIHKTTCNHTVLVKSYGFRPCNVLFLEAEPSGRTESDVSFNSLAFNDMRSLLEAVINKVRHEVPKSATANALLFPRAAINNEVQMKLQDMTTVLRERISLLLARIRSNIKGSNGEESPLYCSLNEIRPNVVQAGRAAREIAEKRIRERRCSVFKNINESIWLQRQGLLPYTDYDEYDTRLPEFLQLGETISLSLHASTKNLDYFMAWPVMLNESNYMLSKLPVQDIEYAGLWGGIFGWPLGKHSRKSTCLLMLSYEVSDGRNTLVATTILNGCSWPNGSPMFEVKVDEPSPDEFPWDGDVKNTFLGKGIASGYGYNCPGRKPGSLYVIQEAKTMETLLAFVWKESGDVLTCRRLNLEELLKKGQRVDSQPPISISTS
ncbi:unnamed protein product [Cuscuta epithymum]|uniref:F-box domain-containing protein n=1 Tax=Cuscuta epithymum TaxID=186058 RepID=A0AAV0EMP9_9ASTE|nr:unnamed protein product [Cuscuta epithymum]